MLIVSILSRHTPSYGSLLRYIFTKRKIHDDEIFMQNIKDSDLSGLVDQFIENESFRRKTRTDQIFLYHEIISFSAIYNTSHISTEVITDLAREYIRLRGDTGVMVGAVHRDKEQVHVHFCVSALQFKTGRTFGMTDDKMLVLKVRFQWYHKRHYPELTEDEPTRDSGESYLDYIRWHAEHQEQIVATVHQCFARAKTQQEFLSLLRNKECHYYEHNGRPVGIEVEEKMYTFKQLLGDRQFERLKMVLTEEEQALARIREARERRQG